MERRFTVCCALCALSMLGCGEPPSIDAGMSLDAGRESDAGPGPDAGGNADAGGVGSPEADLVVSAPGANDGPFGDPAAATNGVRGGGSGGGSLDVYSIGLTPGEELVLAFSRARFVDGPGEDLAVFENPFAFGDGLTFMDQVVVEVSADGERWATFPHDYVSDNESVYSPLADDWVGFAGVTPVLLHADTNPVDPFDREAAGGDGFDLADLPDGPATEDIREDGARFVRLTPASLRDNPDTGAPFVRDPTSNGPDIDGVIARYLVAAPALD